MNPPTTRNNLNTGGEGGGLYLNAYEVSFPFDENMDSPGYLHQSQHILEDPAVPEQSSQYSPFMLISNLRTHLYVSLEKNTWLQKRIEDLEEERNFLRCQLDRFISNMKNQEDWTADSQRGSLGKAQSVRSPSPAPPSPMTTRSGMTRKRLQSQATGTRCGSVPVKQEIRTAEEDKYFEEDGYVEEEEVMSDEEDSSVDMSIRKGKGARAIIREPRMRRVIRITHGRERQRVKDPDGVLMRYQKILSTYQRVRSMSKAFQIHGVDRNTMASTSPIAELLLIAQDKVAEVGEFESSKEKLLDYARRCYKAMDDETHKKVQDMKKGHMLLPISYRFRN